MSDLIRGLDVAVNAFETHGGMGRIYTLRDQSKVLKIADIERSWCKYEPSNYLLLEENRIPHAHLYAHHRRAVDGTEFMVSVLERLEFTVTAFIRAAARFRDSCVQLAHALETMLRLLRAKGLVYGDLSPDNIMFREVGQDRYDLALVDPQFVAPLDAFEKRMTAPKARTFDRIYLALKILNIGIRDPITRDVTERLCTALLGHVPSRNSMMAWLETEAPVGLFVAYDIQGRISQFEQFS